MSIQHCFNCDRDIDTDYDVEHFETCGYPEWVCDSCGVKANRLTQEKRLGSKFDIMKFKRKFSVSTYHAGICDVCGKKEYVTEPRDFFYPDFTLLDKEPISTIKGKRVFNKWYKEVWWWLQERVIILLDKIHLIK